MFGLRLFNTLKRNKINYIEDLTKFTKKELINLDKIGPKQAKILVDILEENNIKLKEEIIEEEYSITT
jgi:DNA-directed RNA polymerase alpha subunit